MHHKTINTNDSPFYDDDDDNNNSNDVRDYHGQNDRQNEY
jgi:hypothetical protein